MIQHQGVFSGLRWYELFIESKLLSRSLYYMKYFFLGTLHEQHNFAFKLIIYRTTLLCLFKCLDAHLIKGWHSPYMFVAVNIPIPSYLMLSSKGVTKISSCHINNIERIFLKLLSVFSMLFSLDTCSISGPIPDFGN